MTAFYPEGSAARRALAVLREQGLGSFWFKLVSELGYRRLILFERLLDHPVTTFETKVPLQIGILEESEVDDYLAFRPGIRREDVLDRLRSAQVCFVARHEGKIVSACWAATRRAWSEFLAWEIALAEGEVYLFDAYTLPVYRGQGVAPAICQRQLVHFRHAGLRRAIRTALPENIPALHAHAKSGFCPFALIGRIKIGSWQYSFQRPYPRHGSLPLG